MNQLRSWLYGRDLSVLGKQIPDGKSDESKSEDGHHRRNKQFESREITESLQAESTFLLGIIPLAPGDCLECKLVGTGVMMLTGIMVITSAITARTRNPKLAGFNKGVYYMLCGGLFIGFEVTAFCRLMDMGPFDKDGSKATTDKPKQ